MSPRWQSRKPQAPSHRKCQYSTAIHKQKHLWESSCSPFRNFSNILKQTNKQKTLENTAQKGKEVFPVSFHSPSWPCSVSRVNSPARMSSPHRERERGDEQPVSPSFGDNSGRFASISTSPETAKAEIYRSI